MKDNSLNEKMAHEFNEFRNPFAGEFLRKHNVSFGDCNAMSARIAALLMAYAKAPRWIQTLMLATGTMAMVKPDTDIEQMWLLGIGDALRKKAFNK
jgi:hypothetical protein